MRRRQCLWRGAARRPPGGVGGRQAGGAVFGVMAVVAVPRAMPRAVPRALAGALLAAMLAASAAHAADQLTLQLHGPAQFEFAGYYAALWEGFYCDPRL